MSNALKWAALDNSDIITLTSNENNTHTISDSSNSFNFLSPTLFDKEYMFNSWEVEGFNELNNNNEQSNGYTIFKNSVLNYKPGYISEVTVYFADNDSYSNGSINKIILAKHIGDEMTILAHGECKEPNTNKKIFKIKEEHYKNIKLDSSYCADPKNAISFIFTSREFNAIPEWEIGTKISDVEMRKCIEKGYGSQTPPEKVLPIIYNLRSKFDEASYQFIHSPGNNSGLKDKSGTLKYTLKINSNLREDLDEHLFKDFRDHHLTTTYKSKIADIEKRLENASFKTPILVADENQKNKNRCFSRIYLSHNTLSNNNLVDIYNKKIKSIKIPINLSNTWESGHLSLWDSYIKNDNFEISLSFYQNPYEYLPYWTGKVALKKIVDGNNILFEVDFSNEEILYPSENQVGIADAKMSGIWIQIHNVDKVSDATKYQIACEYYDNLQVSLEDKIYLHSIYNTDEKDIFVPLTANIKVYFDLDSTNALIDELYQKVSYQTNQIKTLDDNLTAEILKNKELDSQLKSLDEEFKLLNEEFKKLANESIYEIGNNANDNYQCQRFELKGEHSPNTNIIKGEYPGDYYLRTIKFYSEKAHLCESGKLIYLVLRINDKNYYSSNGIEIGTSNILPEWTFSIKDKIILSGSDITFGFIAEIPDNKDTPIEELTSSNNLVYLRTNKEKLPSEQGTIMHGKNGTTHYNKPHMQFIFKYGLLYDTVAL